MKNNTENQEEKRQPEYKTKHGSINGVIWANEKEGKNGVFTSYIVQIDKYFTTDKGQTWNKSKNYFAQDMTNLQKVINDIKEYLDLKEIPTEIKKYEGVTDE
jgi:molecular chaperone DnaK (HSP70)